MANSLSFCALIYIKSKTKQHEEMATASRYFYNTNKMK